MQIPNNGKDNVGMCLKSSDLFTHKFDEHIKKYGGQFATIIGYIINIKRYKIGILGTTNEFDLTYEDLITDWVMD